LKCITQGKDLVSPLGKRRKAEGRLGRVFYLNFFVKFLLFQKSPLPLFKKEGRILHYFSLPFSRGG
jgi:hypothetical protein